MSDGRPKKLVQVAILARDEGGALWLVKNGAAWRVPVSVQPAEPPRKPGRKPATARDVSLVLHHRVLVANGYKLGAADESLAEMFALSDARQVRQIRNGKALTAIMNDDRILVQEGTREPEQTLMVLFDNPQGYTLGPGFLNIDGRGWVTRWGDEAAQYGRVTGSATFEERTNT